MKELKEFLKELSELMIKYGATMEVYEDTGGYCISVEGIDVEIELDNSIDQHREWQYKTLPKCFNGDDIKALIKNDDGK